MMRMRVLLILGTAIATLASWPRMAAPQSAGLAHPASRVTDMREMAMFHNSNVYVWIRATDDGTVLVYASSGFRNAFAQPVTLTADEADRWAALAEPLMADSLRVTVRRERPDTTSSRDQLAFGDFVILSRPRMDPPTLTLKIGELSPNAVTTTFLAPALAPVVPAIREAAQAAREMAASRAADSTARAAALAAATAPTPPVTPAPARETVTAAMAPPTVPLAPALPPASPAESPEPAPTVPASPIAQPLVAPTATVPTTAITTPSVDAAPSVAMATPVVPTVDLRSLPTMTPLTARALAPNVSQRPVPPSVAVRVTAPPPRPAVSTPTIAAAPALVRDTARPATPRPTTVTVRMPQQTTTVGIVATTTPVIPPPPAPAPPASRSTGLSADSSAAVEGGLSDAEFSTEARRRESSMTACYAQYGLSINPSLSGHITVRISLSDSGEVMRATVVDRSWSAAVPTDVESCIVHRVFVWHFPVARRSSTHDYSVTFGH
jgi:type II secretory pathway pseudopilin PulG